MSNCLVLNSTNVIGNNNNTYKYNFINGMYSIKDAVIAVSNITVPYSWYNITQAYNNTTFQFTWYGSSTVNYTVALKPGFI